MYNNKRHQKIFEKEIIKKNENNYALLAVIYLFTSDHELWKVTKDLYLKTGHVTISDITNKHLVDPKLYEIICNGMAIRRFGRNAWCWRELDKNSA